MKSWADSEQDIDDALAASGFIDARTDEQREQKQAIQNSATLTVNYPSALGESYRITREEIGNPPSYGISADIEQQAKREGSTIYGTPITWPKGDEMVESPVEAPAKQGGNLLPAWLPGQSGNPSGKNNIKAWKKVLAKLPEDKMADYFVQGLELAVQYKSSKLILEYGKVYYDRTDGSTIPTIPESTNRFDALILSLNAAVTKHIDDPE